MQPQICPPLSKVTQPWSTVDHQQPTSGTPLSSTLPLSPVSTAHPYSSPPCSSAAFSSQPCWLAISPLCSSAAFSSQPCWLAASLPHHRSVPNPPRPRLSVSHNSAHAGTLSTSQSPCPHQSRPRSCSSLITAISQTPRPAHPFLRSRTPTTSILDHLPALRPVVVLSWVLDVDSLLILSSLQRRPSSVLCRPSSVVRRPHPVVRRPQSVVRRLSFAVVASLGLHQFVTATDELCNAFFSLLVRIVHSISVSTLPRLDTCVILSAGHWACAASTPSPHNDGNIRAEMQLVRPMNSDAQRSPMSGGLSCRSSDISSAIVRTSRFPTRRLEVTPKAHLAQSSPITITAKIQVTSAKSHRQNLNP